MSRTSGRPERLTPLHIWVHPFQNGHRYFTQLAYRMLRRCGCKVVMIVTSVCHSALRDLEGIQTKSETVLVRLAEILEGCNDSAARCYVPVRRSSLQWSCDQGKKKFGLIIQMRITFFQKLIQALHILQNNCSRRKRVLEVELKGEKNEFKRRKNVTIHVSYIMLSKTTTFVQWSRSVAHYINECMNA